MEHKFFNLKAEREALIPPMSRAELARKMGVSWTFVKLGELCLWPQKRIEQFRMVAAEWKKNPAPTPRKTRSDLGKRHRKHRSRRKAA